ncbi:MAG: HD domain-containing protein [Rickettsiales bacterium]|nr:HD domain-containing protein [Rickettsiales bacterium]
MKNNNTIILEIENYIKELFKEEHTGHDYYHAMRVKSIANQIADTEGGNRLIIDISCLLHDTIDDKIQNSLNKNCPQFEDFFKTLNLDENIKNEVLYIINNMSFSKMLKNKDTIKLTKELQIVSDADKMESIGVIGIARCFAYGSKMNRDIYDPKIPSEPNLTQEEYKNKSRQTTSLNHFDEKLLKIDQFIFTKTGKEIAKQRLDFIKLFKKTFLNEWGY